MDSFTIKQELAGSPPVIRAASAAPAAVIELSSSDSDSEAEDAAGAVGKRTRPSDGGLDGDGVAAKKKKSEALLPVGFLDPLPPEKPPAALPPLESLARLQAVEVKGSRQFWKAGDFEGGPMVDSAPVSGGIDHVRVHPKFLHSNATSHKWALGALAELLDNSLDEVCHGATYVNVDMLKNKKDGSKMLLVEDNGGGMDPDKMRRCMSLGYSAKSKVANTIGQYGNGFKTSTMRLGADVIVFSRSRGKEGKSPTQSIGLLSYSYLRNTGKEDIVVPMLDYEKHGLVWKRRTLSSSIDWNKNLETIIDWSPYSGEAELLQQFSLMTDQGTRVVIYNLWEDDQGQLELDFDADEQDIQVRGVNRDENLIQMAKQFPNLRHFLTFRHSLRSYASILYLRLPNSFRMVLRGREIKHHNIVTDMMMKKEVTYRPQPGADGTPKDPNMVAVVTMGFVRDAKHHIDVQGFNVYHKNRLIKPFWRVWNPPGSDGRGVIGVLEANFVEPAHDKQDFERTIVLSRLEARLVQLQKTYWSMNCHKIGYAPRRNKKHLQSEDKESSPDSYQRLSQLRKDGSLSSGSNIVYNSQNTNGIRGTSKSNLDSNHKVGKSGSLTFTKGKTFENFGKSSSSKRARWNRMHYDSNESDSESEYGFSQRVNGSDGQKAATPQKFTQEENGHDLNGDTGADGITARSRSKAVMAISAGKSRTLEESDSSLEQLKVENEALKERLGKMEESLLQELQSEREKNKSLTEELHSERERNKCLTNQAEEAERRLEEASKEQEALIDIFSEERNRRDREEETLQKKLKEAQALVLKLQNQVN